MTDDREAFRKWRYPWHGAVNDFAEKQRGKGDFDTYRFMYEAMHVAEEIARLPLLFKAEREGKLPKLHRQCSFSGTDPVPDNHLTCCLGVECRKCEFLAAIDAAELTPEQRDQAKTYTCVTHIVSKGGDRAGEGYILTTDDRMYWDRVYQNMAAEPPK